MADHNILHILLFSRSKWIIILNPLSWNKSTYLTIKFLIDKKISVSCRVIYMYINYENSRHTNNKYPQTFFLWYSTLTKNNILPDTDIFLLQDLDICYQLKFIPVYSLFNILHFLTYEKLCLSAPKYSVNCHGGPLHSSEMTRITTLFPCLDIPVCCQCHTLMNKNNHFVASGVMK